MNVSSLTVASALVCLTTSGPVARLIRFEAIMLPRDRQSEQMHTFANKTNEKNRALVAELRGVLAQLDATIARLAKKGDETSVQTSKRYRELRISLRNTITVLESIKILIPQRKNPPGNPGGL